MNLKDKVNLLPKQPGCYLMKDEFDEIIYVGKAKDLNSRVKSYFVGAHNKKTTLLISEIKDFSFILTNSEQESLLLELNLIKKYKPKYNIKLMDDKTYPYIEITKEKHPKLHLIRTKEKARGLIFGPFPDVFSARKTVELLNRMYPFRKCQGNSKSPCMYYYMGQCYACSPNKSDVNYQPMIKEVIKFLKGDTSKVLSILKNKMEDASNNLKYELALEYKNDILSIEKTTEKQLIRTNEYKNIDFIGYESNQDEVFLNIIELRQGKITDNHKITFSYVIEPEQAILNYLLQYYEHNVVVEIYVSDKLKNYIGSEKLFPKIIVPKIGDKKKQLDLAYKNASLGLKHYSKLHQHKEEVLNKRLDEFQKLIDSKVDKIEVFDNSHLFGTNPVSAMIVLENGKFNKKLYRKYHIKTSKNDDYASLREVIYRRYQKLLFEEKKMPDLILVDGGLAHVNQAHSVLFDLGLKIKVLGLKKNIKHELESLVSMDIEYKLEKQSELYKFLSSISEEIHRYAITFFRKTKTKHDFKSPLDNISGIGEKRKKLLVKHFKTIENIKNSSLESLIELGIPTNVAKKLLEVLNEKDNT